ncbi:8159_t:CDS:2, partial [Dentiscutata erythropus]
MTLNFSNANFQRRKCVYIFLFIILFATFYLIGHKPSSSSNNLMVHKEKYLTYLPHDGFNNQRIDLENAIFLAWFLNRTLIIPPLLFFKGVTPIISQPYNELYNILNRFMHPNDDFKKNEFKFCFSEYKTDCNFVLCLREDQSNCRTVSYTMYNWEELMDFTFLKQHIKYIHRQDFNYEHLLELLQIYDDKDVYNVTNDQSQYQQRYYDDPTSTKALVYFHRLELFKNYLKANNLMNELVPNNPTIINIVNRIIDIIGGTNNFIGVHARLGDGYFARSQNKTINGIIEKIQTDFEHIDIKNDSTCLPTIIFLATDVKHNHKSLQPFFQTFPCVYMLDDFNDLLEPLKFLKNPKD